MISPSGFGAEYRLERGVFVHVVEARRAVVSSDEKRHAGWPLFQIKNSDREMEKSCETVVKLPFKTQR
jgi:hypothetical protein